MRKRIVNQDSRHVSSAAGVWLDLQHLAQAEISSEEAAHPLEAALLPAAGAGWRAAQPGEQTIRLVFDELQKLGRIRLLFEEEQRSRTQEFVLRWTPDEAQGWREIVRQQYNFSPPGMTRELEDYTVDLAGVRALEIRIIPDIGGGDARASLAQLLIA